MGIEYFQRSLDIGLFRIELYVADNMCNTFIYPEFLIKKYSTLECLKSSEIHSVLDVGCGAGPFGVFFGQLGKKVVGIDINPIAVACCQRNIEKYSLQNKVTVEHKGVENYESESLFDLIVCNPPIGDESFMRKNLYSEYPRICYKLENNIIDAEVEDFLTNCWKDRNGKDMMDYIFERAECLLKPGGKILFVCGDDFVEGDTFICAKVSNNPLFKVKFRQKYNKYLRLKDGGEVFECEKIYNIIVFEYDNNGVLKR